MLFRAGRVTDALSTVDRVLDANGFVHPDVLYQVAGALFGSVHVVGDREEARLVIAKVIDVIQKALEDEKLLSAHERAESSTTVGYVVILGMCYQVLGRADRALEAYNRALSLDPKNDAALVGRGLLQFRSDKPSSIEDFRQAVRGNSPTVWPYCFYAFHLAENSQFDECIHVCRAGLHRTNSPALMAEFYEWIAISQDALGESKDRVKADFEVARLLAPLNPRIAKNYQLFLHSQDNPAAARPDWDLDWEQDPDEASRDLIDRFMSRGPSQTLAA
jgi:tetratricopeptide (TPR) repeat protein